MSNDHKDIIDYLYNHRGIYLFNGWTWEQIARYMLKFFQFNQVRIVLRDDTDKDVIMATHKNAVGNIIQGVIIFEVISPDTIYIVHCVTDKQRSTMGKFLMELNLEYPSVHWILGKRKNTNQVLYNVRDLNKYFLKHQLTTV